MPYRILVIEDDPIMQMILRDTIRAEGYECLLCPNAASAPAAAGQRPDLILLDIHLPDMDGFAVAHGLRRGGMLGAILLISTHVEDDYVERIRTSSADGFINKADLSIETITAMLASS